MHKLTEYVMIELVDIEADHVLGVSLKESLTSRDIDLATNFIDKKIRARGHIALYAEIGEIQDVEPDVILTEIRRGIGQVKRLGSIDRAALVSDRPSIRKADSVMALLPGVEIRTFPTAEKESARAWVSERVGE